MNRLLTAALFSLSLLVSGSARAQSADMAFSFHHLKLNYRTPSTTSPAFQLYPNTPQNPFRLPCDVNFFGGEVIMVYEGPASGPSIYPRFEERLYLGENTSPIASTGYTPGGPTFDLRTATLPDALMPQTSVRMGYHLVNAVDETLREYLFQPSDLPADTLVRLEIKVQAVDAVGVEIPDPDPTDNLQKFWVMRQCVCQ